MASFGPEDSEDLSLVHAYTGLEGFDVRVNMDGRMASCGWGTGTRGPPARLRSTGRSGWQRKGYGEMKKC